LVARERVGSSRAFSPSVVLAAALHLLDEPAAEYAFAAAW